MEERREVDIQVSRSRAVDRLAANLGLKKMGTHFFCPGCQPTARGIPELVIKEGSFQSFRCGAEGDVVGLVKLAWGCDLETAIAWLEKETASEKN